MGQQSKALNWFLSSIENRGGGGAAFVVLVEGGKETKQTGCRKVAMD